MVKCFTLDYFDNSCLHFFFIFLLFQESGGLEKLHKITGRNGPGACVIYYLKTIIIFLLHHLC